MTGPVMGSIIAGEWFILPGDYSVRLPGTIGTIFLHYRVTRTLCWITMEWVWHWRMPLELILYWIWNIQYMMRWRHRLKGTLPFVLILWNKRVENWMRSPKHLLSYRTSFLIRFLSCIIYSGFWSLELYHIWSLKCDRVVISNNLLYPSIFSTI